MPYRCLAVGPKHDAELNASIASYEKRLTRANSLNWQLLPYAAQSDETARRVESASMLAKIKDEDYVVLCDERGQELSSPALAAKLEALQSQSRDIVFVIGGAYGVDDALRDRADFIWSLSSLVFPHQIVRLILAEQLYRVQCINTGHPYHHS